jgi:small nuclear ribonucleoprotein (snRNP)-like protein
MRKRKPEKMKKDINIIIYKIYEFIMSLEYKNFLVRNFGGKEVKIGTLDAGIFKGQLIGVDEHVNLLIKDAYRLDEQKETSLGLFLLRG